jgi:hypothetical protein
MTMTMQPRQRSREITAPPFCSLSLSHTKRREREREEAEECGEGDSCRT